MKIEQEIENIEQEIKLFNQMLNDKENNGKAPDIDYDDYNRFNERLNKQMSNWEEIQKEIDDVESQKE